MRTLVQLSEIAKVLAGFVASGLPDGALLADAGRGVVPIFAPIPPAIMWAIAYEETRVNTDPRVRGKHGEIGRMQILPRTAKWFCPHLDVRQTRDNLACAAEYLRALYQRCGQDWECAVRGYNGSGPRARAYAKRVIERARSYSQ